MKRSDGDRGGPVTGAECDRRHEGLDKCIRTKIGKLTAVVAVWTLVLMAGLGLVIKLSLAATESAALLKQDVVKVQTQVDERKEERDRRDQQFIDWMDKVERKLDDALRQQK